jgi:hypothetical protein
MAAGDVKLITANQGAKKSVVCDGTDDYFSANAFGAARVVTADLAGTFTAWINVVSNSASYAIISLGDWNVDEYFWFGIENGTLMGVLYQGGAAHWDINSTSTYDIADGWHQIGIVHNGTRPIFYLDGVAVAMTDTTATTLASWISVLSGCDLTSIGILAKNGTLTLDMNGAIGEVRYYNLALTADQMFKEFCGVHAATTLNDSVTGVATGLISVWDLDGDYVDGISGHNGTAVNQAYLDPNYSELTKQLNLAWVAAGDSWDITYADSQLVVLHVEGV